MRRAGLIALVVCALTGCHGQSTHAGHEAAPDFQLTSLAGKPLSLAKMRGKVVLLDYWATWCEPCQEEMPRLAAIQRKDGARGLQVIGLSMDDQEATVRAFLKTHPLPYPVAMATPELAERYGRVLGVPTLVLIDRHGRIAGRLVGAAPASRLRAEVDALLAK